jgi:hypothetical protein
LESSLPDKPLEGRFRDLDLLEFLDSSKPSLFLGIGCGTLRADIESFAGGENAMIRALNPTSRTNFKLASRNQRRRWQPALSLGSIRRSHSRPCAFVRQHLDLRLVGQDLAWQGSRDE